MDLGDSLAPVAHEVLALGEAELINARKTLDHWIAPGAAWQTLQLAAMKLSNSNRPSGGRYAKSYTILIHPYPELARIDRKTRRDAIWLFHNEEVVRAWIATLPQNQRDRLNHPTRVRDRFEKRHTGTVPHRPQRQRPRRRSARVVVRQSLRERSREDLELIVGELQQRLDERDLEIAELNEQLDERDREIARLKTDLDWERVEKRQLEGLVAPTSATVVRPDGETIEIVHALSRDNYEVPVPSTYGQPDYAAWAKQLAARIPELSLRELDWLLQDNRAHLDALERSYPGAGVGLTERIRQRSAQLADKGMAG